MSQYMLMSVCRLFVCYIQLTLNCSCKNIFMIEWLQLNRIIHGILAFVESQRKYWSSNG